MCPSWAHGLKQQLLTSKKQVFIQTTIMKQKNWRCIMENRKDQRIKLQLTEQQKEYLRQRTQEQRLSSTNELIRHKLFVETEIKELLIALFQKQQEMLIKIHEKVSKYE